MLLHSRAALLAATALIAGVTPAAAAPSILSYFTKGDVVVSVEGDGAQTGSYADNQAAPLSLYEYSVNGTASSANLQGMLVLPQTSSGSNFAISGEYGSSSEGTLQLSGNGAYLTIMGYGINADTFNADPGAYSIDPSNTALGQSGSQTGQSYTAVPRVVALIGANGSVNTSTAVYNVFNGNNPRSAYTQDGSSFYISGQGNYPDSTGGVFYVKPGVTTNPQSVTGNDAGSGTSQDTREVQVYNGQLYVSTDSKKGSTNRSYVGTLGAQGSLPTSTANGGNGPTQLSGTGTSTGKYTITAQTTNGINSPGQQINLSPNDFVFADNGSVMYVADSGNGKQTSATSSLGDGGLQKWSLVGGTWTLDYTIAAGLDLVANTAASGSTGLYGLAGETITIDGTLYEEIYATNYTIGDTDPTYLYGLLDPLALTSNPNLTATTESFTELAAAPEDANFKGVSFAPVPEPASLALLGGGALTLLGLARRRRA